jgi:hypothetical protein
MQTMMESSEDTQGTPERIGKVLSTIFLVALAALFAYGYAARFISTLHL